MNAYLITYDEKEGQTYTELYAEIKKTSWYHMQYSVWLVATSESISQLRSRLWGPMYADDKLFIVCISGANQAWEGLPAIGVQWIKNNVPGITVS